MALIGAFAVIGLLAIVLLLTQPAQEVKSESVGRKVDVLGTGTSTSGTYNFVATAATTSVLLLLGDDADIIDFDIYPESASSTAHVGIQVLKSNLDNCSQTGGVLQDWADMNQTSATAHIVTLTQATTTYAWIPSATSERGASFQLTNFNSNCAKVFVGGEDVNVYIQATIKSLSF